MCCSKSDLCIYMHYFLQTIEHTSSFKNARNLTCVPHISIYCNRRYLGPGSNNEIGDEVTSRTMSANSLGAISCKTLAQLSYTSLLFICSPSVLLQRSFIFRRVFGYLKERQILCVRTNE